MHSTAGDIISTHGGKVAQYLGDGLLALFGTEQASEQDPEAAIRAALEIQARGFQIHQTPAVGGPPSTLLFRIGIHTGLVVMGKMGAESHKEFTASGDAMNRAARLQSAAPPGGIVISQDTYRHVRGVFDVTPRPPLTVKGKQEPIQTYLVRRAKPRAFRTVTRGVAGIATRTIGREREFQRLQAAYLEAHEQRRVEYVTLHGEAGIGKSRLVNDLRDWIELREETVRILQARAFVGDEVQPYALVRRLWFDRFQIAEDAPLSQAEKKWVKGFHELSGSPDTEPAHALGLLLGLPFANSPFIGTMRNDPQQVRGRAIVVSRELLRAMRREVPVQVLLEDLQWADPSSFEYLQEVLLEEPREQEESLHGMLMVMTGRPEWIRPQQPADTALALHPITLAPLSDESTRELARELLKEVEGTPDLLVKLIVERAEGIPFYAEELVNWFLERGILDKSTRPWRFVPQRLKESPLPATLQHLLLTRLSMLSDSERGAVQRGAVFGRRFWSGGVESLGTRQSEQVLPQLQARGLIEAQPESSFEGEREWSFSQSLLREVTYESMLRRERAELHRKASHWLETQAARAGRLDEFAGLIGEHCERAGDLSRAAEWHLRAGEHALASGAVLQACPLFDRALELLPPVDRERRWRGLWGRHIVLDLRGEREAQRRDIEALLELAEALDDDGRRADARFRQQLFLRALGDNRAVVSAAAATIAAARRAANSAIELLALADETVVLGRLGELTAARQSAEAALERVPSVENQSALGSAFASLAVYYGETGDLARAAELENQAAEIARRVGDRLLESKSIGNLGVDYIRLGLYKLARASLEQSLALHKALGTRRGRAYNMGNLAEVHLRMHDLPGARRLAEEALAEATAVGDEYFIPDCWQTLGSIDWQAGDYATAAASFAKAAEGYRRIGAGAAAIEGLAGLARCALAEGRLEQTQKHAVEIRDYLNNHGTEGADKPAFCFQTIAEIFDALGEAGEMRAAVETGYHILLERADKISNSEWRKSFLENVEYNRALVEMWERMQR